MGQSGWRWRGTSILFLAWTCLFCVSHVKSLARIKREDGYFYQKPSVPFPLPTREPTPGCDPQFGPCYPSYYPPPPQPSIPVTEPPPPPPETQQPESPPSQYLPPSNPPPPPPPPPQYLPPQQTEAPPKSAYLPPTRK